MKIPKFLLYCTDGGKFILKLEGDKVTREFGDILEALAAAAKLHLQAPMVVYNSAGHIVLNIFT